MRGYFNKFPYSVFHFKKVRRYYILYTLEWDSEDPVVTAEDREEMQYLINDVLGSRGAYLTRKSRNA